MKKLVLLLVVTITLISLSGCNSEFNSNNESTSNILSQESNLVDSTVSENTENEFIPSTPDTSSTTLESSENDTTSIPDTTSAPNTPSKPSTSSNSTPTVSDKDKALADAKSKADKGLYLEAMNILKTFLASNNDPDVKSKLDAYANNYVNQQIEEADKKFVTPNKDYEKSLSIIKSALQNVPNSNLLISKRDYYQSFAPVDLSVLSPYKKSYGYLYNTSSSDNFDNEYDKCICKSHYNAEVDALYDLGYKYNVLTATVFTRSDCTGNTMGSIEIYGDNILLYSKDEIDVYGRPFNISVDVTGVQDLKIVIRSDSGAYIYGLGNCVLQRTAK